jgi:hypothetical protein
VPFVIHAIACEKIPEDKMKREFPEMINHGMSCVVASIKADHIVCLVREEIGYFTFSFISPLGANDKRGMHKAFIIIKCVEREYKKGMGYFGE